MKNKRTYEMPLAEIISFEAEDVITASGLNSPGPGSGTEYDINSWLS